MKMLVSSSRQYLFLPNRSIQVGCPLLAADKTRNRNSVIILDMGLLVAGTKYRGEFEERLKKLMEEIKQSDEIILFIDEVHTLIGAGAAEGAIDAANILKPALARGELQPLAKKLGIKVVPTFKILKDKKVVKEVTGAKFDDLVHAIDTVRSS
ncbi:chaperone protein ClpC2, chloroplastic-like isoform X1 [Cucumis melo]|uniref:Chaperone protein ClpC2, chloroplastic-like isoform X1 n=2 Tax=Cucumis melo TaxID=3656 RepID=A0ABM3LBY6_CUCME|nr:chaperone protein ClpC2, chloroplastic-like isoform X1 [Cucumis melo]XP_050947541.1 chaperone protein ClpC2, chloroplastic-like isoform X1 [Cucumis melo]